MRKHFPEYYPPSDQEKADIWGTGLFVLDANVLLHFFRYTPAAREELFSILDQLKGRLWVPHQAALEFHRRRLALVVKQERDYEKWINDADTRLNELLGIVTAERSRTADTADILTAISGAKESIRAALQAAQKRHPGEADAAKVLDRLTDLFEGHVGDPSSEKEQEERLKTASKRVSSNVPPGYKDAGKENGNQTGDVLIWFQMLDKAQADQRPIIFVTDDTKEDWWLVVHGMTKGPRPELLREMREVAGQDFLLYRSDQFKQQAVKHFSLSEDAEVAKEVAEVAAEDISERLRVGMGDWIRTLEGVGGTLQADSFRAIRESIALQPDPFRSLVGGMVLQPDSFRSLIEKMALQTGASRSFRELFTADRTSLLGQFQLPSISSEHLFLNNAFNSEMLGGVAKLSAAWQAQMQALSAFKAPYVAGMSPATLTPVNTEQTGQESAADTEHQGSIDGDLETP